jgi:hypothetical protein
MPEVQRFRLNVWKAGHLHPVIKLLISTKAVTHLPVMKHFWNDRSRIIVRRGNFLTQAALPNSGVPICK